MYYGKQVLRFENNYKSKDLYLIGNELKKRIGTGNYDQERTKFNITYKNLEKENLYQDVKYKLESRNIEYLHKSKTNMLNGVTITSGPEFFMTLGLPFKETNRKYNSGEKEGQNVLVPDIKNKNDIPEEVTKYFDDCYNFLKELVGEENIVIAQAHFDEDTPHLQAYFLPVVNEVRRKCYKRDENGNLLKEIVNGKEVPILLRNEEGKIVYEVVEGKFLNNDQFWKNLGGRNSFSNIQDKFNKYINEKGFNLDRGQVGSNKVHKTKIEHQINELEVQKKKLKKDLNNYKDKINKAKSTLESSLKDTNSELRKRIIGYSKKEVEKLINDFDNLEKLNALKTYELEEKTSKISSLTFENNHYKNNKKLINSEKIRYEQSKELSDKDDELNYYKSALTKIARALDIITKRKPMPFVHNYISYAESVMAGKRLNEMDEEAQREFEEINRKEDDIWL